MENKYCLKGSALYNVNNDKGEYYKDKDGVRVEGCVVVVFLLAR